jgi:putative colanic acid biosynthesis acetyltransferase WcaF
MVEPDPRSHTPETENPNNVQSIFQQLDRAAAYPYTRREYLGRYGWFLVQTLLIRPSLPRAARWRCWWLRRFGASIGERSTTRPSTRVWHPWLLSMGRWSTLGDGVICYNLGPIRIGDHTLISQHVHLCAGTHDHTQPTLPLVRAGITIGSGVWVAADAFIGPGVTIGDNAVIGARAVVTRDVEPGMIVAGNPARPIKRRPGMDDAD